MGVIDVVSIELVRAFDSELNNNLHVCLNEPYNSI